MKGTYFSRPLELQLNVPMESWHQGEKISGEMLVINHGPGPLNLADIGVELSRGELKKVKAKDPKAFQKERDTLFFENTTVPGKGSATLHFCFELDLNAPITDKTHSLYLRYGNFSNQQLGDLQLSILPRPIFQKVAEIADVFLRFKTKDWKFQKGKVIIKMIPPQSKEFLGLEEMHLSLGTENESIHADYTYKQKNLGIEAGVMKIAKGTSASSQVWAFKDAFLGANIPNQTRILELMNQALEKVRRKD